MKSKRQITLWKCSEQLKQGITNKKETISKFLRIRIGFCFFFLMSLLCVLSKVKPCNTA